MVKKGKKIPHKGNGEASKTSKRFEEGHLVAAKVKGYSPWPGRIECISTLGKRVKYTVRFFASWDTADLAPEFIEPFKDFTPKPSDLKKKLYGQAFKLCQNECDSQLAAKDRERDSSPAPSLETAPSEVQSIQSGAQSAQSELSTLPKISASLELPGPTTSSAPSEDSSSSLVDPVSSFKADVSIGIEEDNPTEVKQECDEPKPPVKIERVSPQKAKRKVVRKSPTKLDTRTDNNYTVLPKVEKEDLKSRDLTLKKLQSKVDAKLREKARLKQEETEKRILKSTATLVRINRKLTKFLKASQLLKQVNSKCQPAPNQWILSVEMFESIHGALVKCIVFLSKKRRSDDLKACRDILTDLVCDFRQAKTNDNLPQTIHDKIKFCLKLTRKNQSIKHLINMHDDEFEKQENAMIERKENSVDH